eukprot:CAMPEP_0171459272 /NCGR_PEP_ID=MMETSP0945-20130129/4621_1 /TAXON_ID=109269 /ORGANISM="Vaucheria litorea, Strain CCMP2940" /LENGTH=319 /DNA_ID=CAMNT_0011985255 /DNA_START=56 /DNA_END=1015 /DNA_ORIENTATION=-
MNVIDKLSDMFDSMMGSVKNFIIGKIEPQVSSEVDERVNEYQKKCVTELPESFEAQMKENSRNNAAAWAIYKTFGEDTSEIVESMLKLMRPGIDAATDSLADKITEVIMEGVRDGLDIDGSSSDEDEREEKREEEEEGNKSRGLEDGFASRGIEHAKVTAKKKKKTIEKVKTLDQKMDDIEKSTRERAHPLFESLQDEIEKLMPICMRQALIDDFEKRVDVESNDSDDDEVDGFIEGFFEHIKDGKKNVKQWYKKTTNSAKEVAVDALIAVIGVPIGMIVDREVAELEEDSMDSSFKAIRRVLEKFHIISKQEEKNREN